MQRSWNFRAALAATLFAAAAYAATLIEDGIFSNLAVALAILSYSTTAAAALVGSLLLPGVIGSRDNAFTRPANLLNVAFFGSCGAMFAVLIQRLGRGGWPPVYIVAVAAIGVVWSILIYGAARLGVKAGAPSDGNSAEHKKEWLSVRQKIVLVMCFDLILFGAYVAMMVLVDIRSNLLTAVMLGLAVVGLASGIVNLTLVKQSSDR